MYLQFSDWPKELRRRADDILFKAITSDHATLFNPLIPNRRFLDDPIKI